MRVGPFFMPKKIFSKKLANIVANPTNPLIFVPVITTSKFHSQLSTMVHIQEKATVKIYLAGQCWGWNVFSGSTSHVPSKTYAKTGQQLVDICNRYKIKVLNPDAIVPELANQLLLK